MWVQHRKIVTKPLFEVLYPLPFKVEEVPEDCFGDGLGGPAVGVVMDEEAWFGIDFDDDGISFWCFLGIPEEHVNARKCYSHGFSRLDSKP